MGVNFHGSHGSKYPILKLIEKKIQASEFIKFGEYTKEGDNIWRDYFTHHLFDVPPEQFLIEFTWCNPRDIVVLLGGAANSRYQEKHFSTQIITQNLSHYSQHCWREREDELRAIYPPSEVEVIKDALRNWKTIFKLDEFERDLMNDRE
jgi:hypothetical protein